MRIVMLSGGSGKRLWPLSNNSRSKQFLKVLMNDQGLRESMIQRVWRQLKTNSLSDKTYVATSKSQVEVLKSQIGDKVALVLEPEAKDTFMAVMLSASYLCAVECANPDEVMMILPVDLYVEDSFFEHIKGLPALLTQSNADIALLGVPPEYPTSKYGYILPNKPSKHSSFYTVSDFREKPDLHEARQLIENQALWNCGVLAVRLGFLKKLASMDYGLDLDNYKQICNAYTSMDPISFDKAVLEKTKNIIVVPYRGHWRDLGTWGSLVEEMPFTSQGKCLMDNCHNTHIVNDLDIPIVASGISNSVIVASPDGILVADKSTSHTIKEVIPFNNLPMYEERNWGWYRILEYARFHENGESLTKRVGLRAGCHLSYQVHQKRNEAWTFIKGTGTVVLNEQLISVKAGDVINIASGLRHAVKAHEDNDLEFIEVQTGLELIEEDIHRISSSWEHVLAQCQSQTLN